MPKQNFMKLTFHLPILKLTTSVHNHNKEHMELKFRMKEVSNETFLFVFTATNKKIDLEMKIFRAFVCVCPDVPACVRPRRLWLSRSGVR